MPESEGSVNAQSHESSGDPIHPRDVFLSYASPDAAIANAVVESLEHHGIACWIAPRDVVPGSLYADGIARAINGASQPVVERHIANCTQADPAYGKGVADAIDKLVRSRIVPNPVTEAAE